MNQSGVIKPDLTAMAASDAERVRALRERVAGNAPPAMRGAPSLD